MSSVLRSLYLLISLMVSSFGLQAATLPMDLRGPDLLTGQEIHIQPENKKAVVVVFLSAVCPCSDSHLQELKALSKDFPDFHFVGIHSNTDEEKEMSKAYFKKSDLPFPVVQDSGAKIADQMKALKTPHAFVINAVGETLYQGGVSSSARFENANKKILREAMNDIQNGRKVRTPEGRTLGCIISRGEQNVW